MNRFSRYVLLAFSSLIAWTMATMPARAITYHQVYVLNAGNRSITIYADSHFGDVRPVRRIAGNDTRIADAVGMAVDRFGRIYVLNHRPAEILVFGPGAHGNVAPASIIGGVQTLLSAPRALAVDSHDEIVVADAATGLQMFAFGASGDVAPIRSLSHAAGIPFDINGVGADQLGDVYFTSASSAAVTEIYAVKSEQSALAYVLEGPHTLIRQPAALSVDRFGRMYVSDSNNSSLVFAAGARGDTAPYVAIRGPKTGLNGPGVSGFDSAACVFTPNARANSVTEFDPDTTGNTAPTSMFVGPHTQLAAPIAVVYL